MVAKPEHDCGASYQPSKSKGNLVLALALFGTVLYVPYFVPQSPTASDSYVFGYNNRAGLILLVVCCSAVAIWKKGFDFPLLPAASPRPVPRRTLWICISIQVLVCAGMIWITRAIGGFREANYELSRIFLLSIGRTPYRDFEWPFGALLLYAPLWLSRLLHCSQFAGYCVFWTAASAVGVWLLWATINKLDYPSPRKSFIFLLLFGGSVTMALGMGAHYTLLRYLPPFYCMLVVYGVVQRRRSAGEAHWAVGLAICFAAAILLISPEMAAAYCFAAAVLLIPYRRARNCVTLPWVEYAAMLLGFLALFLAALKLGELDTLLRSGGGADSFPLVPSAPVIYFLCVVFACACVLVRRWRDPSLNDNSVVLMIVSIPLLAAALGRCDPGHIGSNGLGLFLALFLYSSVSARGWRQYVTSYVIAMMVVPSPLLFLVVLPQIGGLVRKAVRGEPATDVPARIEFASLYPGANFAGFDTVLQAPFGYKPNGLGSYLSRDVDFGFYNGIENANTPAAVQLKIDELRAHRHRMLLLPDKFYENCRVDGHFERILMTALFSFPYAARVSHSESVRAPLCKYISDHYKQSYGAAASNFSYSLWYPVEPADTVRQAARHLD